MKGEESENGRVFVEKNMAGLDFEILPLPVLLSVMMWVCLKIVYPMTQWLRIIIPIKWL